MEPHFWLSQGKWIGICTSSPCELTWNLLGLMWSRMAEMARCILEPPWNISTVPHKSSSIYRRLWDACRQRQRAFQVLSHTLDWHLSISLVRGRSTKILQKFTWTLIYRRPHLWHRSRRWWESCRQINITLRHRLIWLSPIHPLTSLHLKDFILLENETRRTVGLCDATRLSSECFRWINSCWLALYGSLGKY